MKRYIAIAALVTLGCSAHTHAKVLTKEGHVACYKREWMEDILDFIRTGNKAKYRHYIESKRCVFMKGDVEVRLIGTQKVVGVVVSFEYNRRVMWTYWSSLVYEK